MAGKIIGRLQEQDELVVRGLVVQEGLDDIPRLHKSSEAFHFPI